MINKLVIIGVGLIGGSLARALRVAGHVKEVVGCGRGLENLQQAVTLGVVDHIETSLARAAQAADMIVLAVPVGAIPAILAEIKPYLSDRTVITDVGSVKGSVEHAARAHLGDALARFVPAHPIAGTEKSGVTASFPELFRDRRVVLTPLAETQPAALEQVRQMWHATGAKLVSMSVQHHDEILAATSHLPHLLAYSLVDILARRQDSSEIFDFAAGGFRDFTRIASSDPVMWRDICLANRQALAAVLRHYHQELDILIKAVERGDTQSLFETFTRAKLARDALLPKFGDGGEE